MKIVFVSYLNRSGSTFLVNQLSRHPDICVCPEADILYELLLRNPYKKLKKNYVKSWKKYLANDDKFQNWRLDIKKLFDGYSIGSTCFEFFQHIIRSFRDRYYPDTRFVVFKQNFLLSLISILSITNDHELFWISLMRDPRSIYASQKTTIAPQNGKIMENNPFFFIIKWNRYCDQIAKQNNKNHICIRYEELVSNLYTSLDKIAFLLKLNLPFKETYLGAPQVLKWLGQDYRKIHTYINNPPQTIFVDKWKYKLSQFELSILSNFLHNNTQYHLKFEGVKFSLKHKYLLGKFCVKLLSTVIIMKLRLIKFKYKTLW